MLTALQTALIALLVGLVVGFGSGWTVADWRADAARVASVERAIRQADDLAVQDRYVLAAGADRATRTETVFRTIDREVIRYVTKPVAAAVCLDPDGLLIWTAANANEWTLAAAPPRHSLSGFAGPSLRQGGRPAGQPRDDDAGVPHLPGPAQDAGGVGLESIQGVKP